jgi:glyoxylase I family protein
MGIQVHGVCALLQVFDMPTSLRFYRDVLGFEIVQSAGDKDTDTADWVWIRLGGADLMLNTAFEADERPDKPEIGRHVSHSDTGLYFDCPDVDAAYEHLRARGVVLKPPRIASYGMRQLYVTDPDGYSICFQSKPEAAAAARP